MAIACGRCRDCRMRRSREWAIRCHHEILYQRRASFLTLTYETDPVTVKKSELQKFFKRLREHRYRKDLGGKISYFACGEYGTKLSRPHYHVILFGENFEKDRYPWKNNNGAILYRSPTLEEAWPFGFAHIGEATMETAGYVARYIQKKQYGAGAIDHYVREVNGLEVNVNPEFQLQSHKPAIGIRWLEENYKDVFRKDGDSVVYRGREYPAPKAYVTWLKVNDPDLAKIVLYNRRKAAEEAPRETGERLYHSGIARDQKYDKLRREYEDHH